MESVKNQHKRKSEVEVLASSPGRDMSPGGKKDLYGKIPRIEKGGIIALLLLLSCLIFLWKLSDVLNAATDSFLLLYSIFVGIYIVSRFFIARWYKEDEFFPAFQEKENWPSVSIVIPVMNEEDVIEETVRSCFHADYPEDCFEVVVIDDGSTDNTLAVLRNLEKTFSRLKVIVFPQNRGKRHGMAEGVLAGKGEMIIFLDSDSRVEKDAIREILRPLSDPFVGAVAGNAFVWNKDVNFVTKMQAVRYFVAFNVFKKAESVFSSVTCCSGCFSAYRRGAIEEVLDDWLGQTFLGTVSTFGDDRSLTNFLLPRWRVVYADNAIVHTIVPDTLRKFMKQQLRWKKSWIRESFRAGGFIWKKNPIMAFGFYLGTMLPVVTPHVVLRSLFLRPIFLGGMPFVYLLGIIAMSIVYGLYYRMYFREKIWIYGSLFAVFYLVILVWQLPWAVVSMTDNKWGTR